jgi:electron transfer flavoprotein beta subunit
MSSITVLVAPHTHPVSGKATRSRADATAVALALGLPAHAVRLLCAGAMPAPVAQDYLALGAPLLETVDCAAHTDIASLLAPALHHVPWVLTGTRTAAEQGSNLLPYALAAALGRPVIADVLSVEPDGSHWIVTQALPKGARRRLRVAPPAVLAVSASAPVQLRHALAAAQAGRVVHSSLPAGSDDPRWTGETVLRNKRRAVLQARTVQSGHARMMGAIESPATGGTVVHSGTPQQKAQAVLDYLRSHAIVHF